MSTPTKRGPGQPKKEPTKLVRAYATDVPKLKKHGKTQAEAIRNLLQPQASVPAFLPSKFIRSSGSKTSPRLPA
jgi:hypothetical protein